MAENKKISQLPTATSVNTNDYTVMVDGNNSTNKRATVAQIMAAAGGGTVTSIGLAGTQGVSVSGSPVTSSGTITVGLGVITPTAVTASGEVTGSNLSGTNTGDQSIQLLGDVEAGAGTGTLITTIATGMVTNAKLANMTGSSIKGRASGVGAPQDLTMTQVAAMLPAVVGDSGSGGTAGLVPAPGAGSAAAKKFLRADATWVAPDLNDLTPTQSGNAGKALFTDGTTTSWQPVSGAGTVTSVNVIGGATGLSTTGGPVTAAGTIALTGTVNVAHGGTGGTTAADARTNLGVTATGSDTTYAYRANNLSDLGSASTARTNLGVTATGSDTTYAYRANNLSDLASASTARTNLGLGTAATQNTAVANGVATLDSGGKLTSSQIPDIAVVSYLGSVASQAAMLALTGQQGDWCTRSDLGTNWIITGANPALLASWTQLSYPTAPVTSVNGYTGAVSLVKADIGLGSVENTALSTWAGSGNITAIGTLASGTVPVARVSGLGTIATQAASSVAITGGAIDGTAIGGTTKAAGGFSTLTATGTTTLATTLTGLLKAASGVVSTATSSTDYAPATPSGVGYVLAGNGSGGFTNVSSLTGLTYSAGALSVNWATPGAIGSTTANTGAFTTLSASSTVSGTGFSNYLASPPAIGATAAAAGTFTTLSDSIGNVRLVPQNSQSVAYTLVASDSGKHILHPSADTTARTFTIPANSSVAYAIGTAITFVNQASAGTLTIAITTDTMRLAGAGTTGSRTLAANGIATALKVTATEWIISGTGLT